jgi:NADPH:quinone reductase-like Zn-dependent oxidoreductase
MRFFTGLVKPSNPVLGTDFAGVIESFGKSVSGFNIGDKVFGFNDQGMKSQAEFMVCNEKGTISHIPNNASFQQVAACAEGAHYAINFINKVKLEKGQRAFVNGASGAIGSALVQLLKYHGLYVAATSSQKSLDLVASLGVDHIIDFEKEDFTAIGETFDYVFDAVGKSTFGKCKTLLKPNGIYISSELGPWAQNIFFSLLGLIKSGKKVKFPFPHDVRGSLAMVKKLMEEDKFKPFIDKEFTLADISKAYTYVETGQKSGNVIVNVSPI